MKPKIFEKSIAKRFNSYEKQKTTHRKKWLHLKQLHFVKNTFHMKNMLFQIKGHDFTYPFHIKDKNKQPTCRNYFSWKINQKNILSYVRLVLSWKNDFICKITHPAFILAAGHCCLHQANLGGSTKTCCVQRYPHNGMEKDGAKFDNRINWNTKMIGLLTSQHNN